MSEPTVSASYAKELLDFAVLHGANKATLFETSGIRPVDLQDPDNRLPFAQYVALMNTSKVFCDDPAFALRLGAETDFEKISVVGLMCFNATTMGEALMMLNRYGYLVAELDVPNPQKRFQLVRKDGRLWLEDTRNSPCDFPELTEETWARFVTSNRKNFENILFATEVHVPHARPDHWAEYEKILKIPVVFSSKKNALLLTDGWPDIKLPFANKYVLGLLSDHADKLMKTLESSKTVRGQVESTIIPILHKGELGMGKISKQLGYSRQTLYRRLKHEGVSYDKVLDELRHKMALHYLSGKKTTVNETAYLVGFSDPSAFSRAFKRWTGKRPGQQG